MIFGQGRALVPLLLGTLVAGCAPGPGSATQQAAKNAKKETLVVPDEYATITAALDAMRALRAAGDAGRIVIHVRAGTYVGTYGTATGVTERLPILIDEPDVTLEGETVLTSGEDGLPEAAVAGTETTIRADAPVPYGSLVSAIVLVARTEKPDGRVSGGDDAVVSGLIVRELSDEQLAQGLVPNGQGIVFENVQNFRNQGNWLRYSGCIGAYTIFSSGIVTGTLGTNNFCAAFCSTGGTPSSPADVTYAGDSATSNALGGMLLVGSGNHSNYGLGANSASIVPVPDDPTDSMTGTITDSRFTSNGLFGIRLMMFMPNTPPQRTATLTVDVTGNALDANGAYGVSVDSGFSWKETGDTFSATFDGTFSGNSAGQNGIAPAIFSLITLWDVLPPNYGSSSAFEELRNSTYAITDDGALDPFNYFVGAASNQLLVNGVSIRGSKLN